MLYAVQAVGHLCGFPVTLRVRLSLYIVNEVGRIFSNTLESTLCAKVVK